MKKLVIYDSLYGNTEKVARVVAESISAKAIAVKLVNPSDLNSLDMIVIGSPTQGGRATPSMLQFLENISADEIKNVKTAVFDTRFSENDLKFPLRLLVKTIGYAAPKIAEILKNKGAEIFISPEGFIVTKKEGPLAPGELERAREWLKL